MIVLFISSQKEMQYLHLDLGLTTPLLRDQLLSLSVPQFLHLLNGHSYSIFIGLMQEFKTTGMHKTFKIVSAVCVLLFYSF